MQKVKRSRAILIIPLLLVLMFSPLNGLLYAQDGSPQVIITGVNVEQFPNISVTIYGEGLGVALADANFELLEDNTPQSEIENATEAVGIQVALVLDAATNISLPGQTGVSRLEEVNNAISQLTQGQILIEQDWIAGVAFDRRDDTAVPAVIAPWNLDHQAVINSFFSYQPNPAHTITPLVDQIFFAMDQFNDARVPTNLRRHIVVFSDGVDVLSPRVVDDLPRRAENLGVRIHTVQIGPSDVSRNLQRIADITGGTFHSINAQTPTIDALWQTLKAEQSQRRLTYRSTRAAPEEVTVLTTTSGGTRLRDTAAIPSIGVEAPIVEIVKPQSGRIEKNATEYDTPLAELKPTEVEVEIVISWPDGRPRTIRSIEYTINGTSRRTTPGDVTKTTLSIADLDNGTHTLRVRATDELGLWRDSAPFALDVVVNRPEPTPTPNFVATREFERAEATATRAAEQTATAIAVGERDATATVVATIATATAVARGTEVAIALEISAAETATAIAIQIEKAAPPVERDPRTWIALVSSVLAVAALFIAIRNPRVRQRATEIVTGTIQAVTELAFGGSYLGASGSPKARLILQDGDPSLPATIDLFSSSTRLGRDPKLVSTVIEDRRISRLHCRIAEEASGAFKIWDEGSTSGTYVNHQKVEMSGHVLQPGDLIHIGPVSYRFEPLLSSMGTGADPTMDATAHDMARSAPGSAQGQSTIAQMTEAATQYDMSGMDAPTQADLSNYSSEAFDSTQYVIKDEFDDNAPYDSNGKQRK